MLNTRPLLFILYINDLPLSISNCNTDMYFHYSFPLWDQPFNLQGGGGYVFLLRSEFFFRTTRELEYFFFLSRKAGFFFQKSTLGYMTC
jgi:hypothetical protein